MADTLIFPVVGDYRISSPFGPRSSPGGIGSTNHKGIDIKAVQGTPVVAPVDFKISQAGWSGGYGNLVRGVDSAGNTYEFGHLSEISVKNGQQIQAGQVIGAVGSTGNSTGPHLHFGIKDAAGKYINPANLLNTAKQAGKDTLAIARETINKARDAATKAVIGTFLGGPVVGAIAAASSLSGSEDCGRFDVICKLQKWLKEGDFFTRLAVVIVAVVLLVAAFMLLARAQTGRLISMVKKG